MRALPSFDWNLTRSPIETTPTTALFLGQHGQVGIRRSVIAAMHSSMLRFGSHVDERRGHDLAGPSSSRSVRPLERHTPQVVALGDDPPSAASTVEERSEPTFASTMRWIASKTVAEALDLENLAALALEDVRDGAHGRDSLTDLVPAGRPAARAVPDLVDIAEANRRSTWLWH